MHESICKSLITSHAVTSLFLLIQQITNAVLDSCLVSVPHRPLSKTFHINQHISLILPITSLPLSGSIFFLGLKLYGYQLECCLFDNSPQIPTFTSRCSQKFEHSIRMQLVKNPYIRAQTSGQLTASDPIRTTHENIAIYCGELPAANCLFFRKKNKGQ